ncbi:hypothetical protein [Vreelandella sp. GE22]
MLNSQWMAGKLSNLDGVDIQWQRATSPHPGQWEVENLTLTRQDQALPVSLEAERATLSLSLLALLRGALHIHALDAEGIRRFQVGDIALEAEGELHLRDSELSGDTPAASDLMLAVTQGRLLRPSDGAILARDIQLNARATLAPVVTRLDEPQTLTPALLEALSARLDASASADAWDVFMPYLEALPWLGLSGSGALEASLGLENGVLTEQSELVLSAPALRFSVDTAPLLDVAQSQSEAIQSATGNGQVRLGVDDSKLHFLATLEDVVLADSAPYATDTALSVATSIPNRRIDRLAPPSGATLELEGRVTRLNMLDRYASAAAPAPLAFTGQGRLRAYAEVQDAALHRGEIRIEAQALSVAYQAFQARGDGVLTAERLPHAPLKARLVLDKAILTHHERTLLADAEIALDLESPLDDVGLEHVSANLAWQNARLPSIAALTPYLDAALPAPGALALVSGQARSQGALSIDNALLSGEVTLAGERWVTRLADDTQPRTLTSDAELALTIASASLDGETFDLSGSSLRWQVGSADAPEERLESALRLRQGRFQRQGGVTAGRFNLQGGVQQLGFLNAFLPEGHGLALAGRGELFLDGAFRGAELLAPTRLRVNANALEAHFLDYVAAGRGELTAEITSADDASLTLGIPQFTLLREGDDRAALAGRHLALTTQTAHFRQARQSPSPEHFTTRIALPVVEVPDITRYGDYLPDTDGFALLGGQASLESEWRLTGYQAEGEITLRAFETELALLEQRLRGDIELHLALSEGDWQSRRFRASDSSVKLENVFRLSEQGAQDAGWWVRLAMTDAALTWGEPIHLKSSLRLSMRDSGLLARLFLTRARQNDWLGRLLDVRGIEGEAQLEMSGERIALHGISLRGGPLLMLSDIILEQKSVSGGLYVRLGALGLGVELVESEPSLRLLQPRRWFDRWRQARRQPRP